MGVGDALMATGEIRHLRKKNPESRFVVGDRKRSYWNEVFENNPYIIRGSEAHKYNKIIWIENYEGNRPYRNYGKHLPSDNYNWKNEFKPKRGEFFFTNTEINLANKIISAIKNKIGGKKIIFIEPHVKKRLGYQNRDWGFAKWQEVVTELNGLYEFIQITYGQRKKIKGCINVDGLNFRTSAAILSMCDLFLGPEGGMHHAAAATNKEAVVIFGGHISPNITGYNFHSNLFSKDPKSPCGSKNSCDHCYECLKNITTKKVINEIKKII